VFKVGDAITAWETGKECIITAIGDTKFLYRQVGRQGEYMCKISCHLWRLVSQDPDREEHDS